jgi:hypothetical protein
MEPTIAAARDPFPVAWITTAISSKMNSVASTYAVHRTTLTIPITVLRT